MKKASWEFFQCTGLEHEILFIISQLIYGIQFNFLQKRFPVHSLNCAQLCKLSVKKKYKSLVRFEWKCMRGLGRWRRKVNSQPTEWHFYAQCNGRLCWKWNMAGEENYWKMHLIIVSAFFLVTSQNDLSECRGFQSVRDLLKFRNLTQRSLLLPKDYLGNLFNLHNNPFQKYFHVKIFGHFMQFIGTHPFNVCCSSPETAENVVKIL